MPERLLIRCLVVDDEPLARHILEHHIIKHPEVMLAGSCGSTAQAADILQNTEIGLILLDVRMPRTSGIDFARAVAKPPAIVFTTAHSEYAVDAFALRAVDYLVKPVAFDRFAEAVSRVQAQIASRRPESEPHPDSRADSIFLRVDQRLVRVSIKSIEFVEACENYVRFHTAHKVYLTKRTMKEVEGLLTERGFIRVHRSFLVNVQLIDCVELAALRVNGKVIPMSQAGRDIVLPLLPKL